MGREVDVLVLGDPGVIQIIALVDARQDLVDALDDRLRGDAVHGVVVLLDLAAASGLLDGGLHRSGHGVGVEDGPAGDVAGGPAEGLDESRRGPQETLLVGVEDGHERDLGQVQALAEEVDADQGVELALAQVAEDVDPVERLDLRMKVTNAQAELVVVAGQVLGHLFCQRRDEDALVPGGPGPDLGHEVVDLAADGPDLELRVGQPRRADDLFDHPAGRSLQLVDPRRRRDVEGLTDAALELVEVERAVVEGRGQSEAVVDEGQLARAVARVHPADLGHGDVGLVDDGQEILGEVVEQGEGRFVRPCGP